MKTIQEARALLQAQLRVHLGFFPTPLHKLEKVSRDTGVNVWIKREDFSGMTLFGGNKIRKLEYLLWGRSGQGVRYRDHLRGHPVQPCHGDGHRRL